MLRLLRPAVFVAMSVAATAGFVYAGRVSADRVDWGDIGGWLDRVEPVDAFAEMARWIGLILAIYVALVSVAALLAELAAVVRLPKLHRGLSLLVRSIALPALRHRLLEVTTVATMSAASLQSAPAGAVAAPDAGIELIAEPSTRVEIVPAVRGEYHGFGAPANVPAQQNVPASHVVRAGDTLWDIVRNHYGHVDPGMVEEVAAANPLIDDPNLILVGWEIVLPELAMEERVEAPPRTVDGEATWSVATVREGDTLWDIVDGHYGTATAELVWATIEANPEIDDPSVIVPGQLITLPPSVDDAVATTLPASVEVDLPPPTTADLERLPPLTTHSTDAAPPTTVGEVEAPTSTGAEATTPRTIPSDPTISTAATESVADRTVDSDEVEVATGDDKDEDAGPSVAQLVGWTGGAGLAAALLGLAARRRRRRPPAERHERPNERAVRFGVALHETDNLATAEWAAIALRSLASELRPRPGEPTPVPRLLRLDGDQLELVWDVPNPEVCAPWRSQDGGWSWSLERPDALRPNDGPSPCPGLVTIGKRDAADVLLNLESCGSVAITGDPDEAASLVSSIVLELAGSAFADAPTVLLVGLPSPSADPEHARAVDVNQAIGWMRDRNNSATALLAQRRLTSLFALRARSRPQDSHEPLIVIVDSSTVDEDQLTEMIDLANGDLGSVLLLTGPSAQVPWNLDCGGAAVRIQPLDLTLEGLGLDDQLNCLIEEFVPEADPGQDELAAIDDFDPDEIDCVLADHVSIALDRSPSTPSTSDADGPDWDVELKVLGQVRCVGLDEPLTPTELHLAIFLAFHPNGENSDTISAMVWPKGAAQRTVTNTMASLRRKLGTGSDGELLFPLGRDSDYLYKLSPKVTTDWDQFLDLTQRAEALPRDEAVVLLDEALDLIAGPPFRAATGYSWAYSDGTASLIRETVALTARRSVDLHLERSEPLAAARAASHGARAMDDISDVQLVTRVQHALGSSEQESSA